MRQVIDFPILDPVDDVGYIHFESANGISYKWDGVKWDPYDERGSRIRQNWTRIERAEILHPTDIDDVIAVRGVRDDLINYLGDGTDPTIPSEGKNG